MPFHAFKYTIFFLLTSSNKAKKMDPIESPPSYKINPLKQIKSSPLYQLVLSKQARIQQRLTPDSLLYTNKVRPREQPILRSPKKTNPIIWFGAILCMVFSLLLIFFAISTLIIFLVVKPKTPILDTPAASLNLIHVTAPELVHSDLTFLANFSNPNWKMNVRYEYLYFEFFFSEIRIGEQVVPTFNQRPGEARWISVHMVSNNLVRLPPNLAAELQMQEQLNRVIYNIKGSFKVRVKFGSIHFRYWLHSNCRIEMTNPPNSMLITHSCTTKK